MRKLVSFLSILTLTVGFGVMANADAANHTPVTKKQVKQTTQTKKAAQSKRSISKKAIQNARRAVNPSKANVAKDIRTPSLQSGGALILNANTGEVIYEKNADEVTPIASITKLMTAMVVLDANLPLNEVISISTEDVDTLKGTTSRLRPGTQLTRGEMLLLALMASENRAASALARHYPGGREAFIQDMNAKAASLGMHHSHFYDSTGLNPGNAATPRDLALMVKAARKYTEIHQFSTSSTYILPPGNGSGALTFNNTNPLVKNDNWDIGLSKTGFINEAGRCLVMQARINQEPVIMVLMDSNGKFTRIGDANRVKKWLEKQSIATSRAG